MKLQPWLKRNWQPILAIGLALALFLYLVLAGRRVAPGVATVGRPATGPGGGSAGELPSGGQGIGSGAGALDPVAAFKDWFNPAQRADLRPGGRPIADYIGDVLGEFKTETGLQVELPDVYKSTLKAFQQFASSPASPSLKPPPKPAPAPPPVPPVNPIAPKAPPDAPSPPRRFEFRPLDYVRAGYQYTNDRTYPFRDPKSGFYLHLPKSQAAGENIWQSTLDRNQFWSGSRGLFREGSGAGGGPLGQEDAGGVEPTIKRRYAFLPDGLAVAIGPQPAPLPRETPPALQSIKPYVQRVIDLPQKAVASVERVSSALESKSQAGGLPELGNAMRQLRQKVRGYRG